MYTSEFRNFTGMCRGMGLLSFSCPFNLQTLIVISVKCVSYCLSPSLSISGTSLTHFWIYPPPLASFPSNCLVCFCSVLTSFLPGLSGYLFRPQHGPSAFPGYLVGHCPQHLLCRGLLRPVGAGDSPWGLPGGVHVPCSHIESPLGEGGNLVCFLT